MRHLIGLLTVAAGAAVAFSAPASADQAEYIRKIQSQYVFLITDNNWSQSARRSAPQPPAVCPRPTP